MTLNPSSSETCRRARPLLGTIVEIVAAGPSSWAALDAAFAAVQDVHRLMSFHEAGSDVSRINVAPAGVAVVIDLHTHRVLRFAQQVSAACDGVFDVTVGDVLVHHKFLPRLPTLDATPREASWRDLELLAENQVRWLRPGCIDLGGIAKGYAVDRAIQILQQHGMSSGLVNAGGDLRMFGVPQSVHVRLPESPGVLAPLGWFADCALATSAACFSAVDSEDGALEPLVDRRRRICHARRGSATVIAAECMTADALTKVVRLVPRLAPGVLERFGARAIVMDGTRQKHIPRERGDGAGAS